MKNLILLIIIPAVFVSCNLSHYRNSRNIIKEKQFHFKLRIVDNKNNPIENAYVEVSIKDGASYKAKSVFDTTLTTNEDGFYEKSILINSYDAVLDYYVQRAGYCSKEGYLSNESNQTKINDISYITLSKDTGNIVDFKLKCLSLKRQVISNIAIDYKAIINDSVNYSGSCVSNSEGIASGILSLSCDVMKGKINLKVMSQNDDYYFVTETFSDISKNKTETFELEFISKKDFFNSSFIESNDFKTLKQNIIGFIDLLQLKSLLTNSILEYYSINILEFKNNRYLTFDFNHTNEYNSLQLDKYEIAKRIFDEVIRKVLNPLNDNLDNSKEFEGYKLSVKTRTRSFTDDKDRGEELIYEFYIPTATVQSYKNLDITGQQVLDNSIILLNGERIDLKLQ